MKYSYGDPFLSEMSFRPRRSFVYFFNLTLSIRVSTILIYNSFSVIIASFKFEISKKLLNSFAIS